MQQPSSACCPNAGCDGDCRSLPPHAQTDRGLRIRPWRRPLPASTALRSTGQETKPAQKAQNLRRHQRVRCYHCRGQAVVLNATRHRSHSRIQSLLRGLLDEAGGGATRRGARWAVVRGGEGRCAGPRQHGGNAQPTATHGSTNRALALFNV